MGPASSAYDHDDFAGRNHHYNLNNDNLNNDNLDDNDHDATGEAAADGRR